MLTECAHACNVLDKRKTDLIFFILLFFVFLLLLFVDFFWVCFLRPHPRTPNFLNLYTALKN